MGSKHDYVIHDLPTILERWRISKLDYSCRSSQRLFNIMETPLVPYAHSSSGDSSSSIEKTPERASRLRLLHFSSYQRSITSKPRNHNSAGNLNESCILSSFDSLHIMDEDDTFEVAEAWREDDVSKVVDGAIKKEPTGLCPKSFSGECFSAFTQLLMVCRQSAPVRLSEVFSAYWLVLLLLT